MVSRTGRAWSTCFDLISRSQSGSNFFQPPAYAMWRSRGLNPCFDAAPRQIEPHL